MVNGTFINQSIIYFNKLRQRAKKTRSKYERVYIKSIVITAI